MREEFCPIRVWYRFHLLSLGLSLLYFFLFPSWDSKFSVGERLGLQAGQLSTQTLLLWSHAVLIDAVCCLALCFLNMEDLPWKRCHLDGSIRCSKVFICLPAQMVPFQNVRRQFHRHECRPLTIRLFYWWSLSSLVWRMRHPCFPKRIKELQNSFSLSFSLF